MGLIDRLPSPRLQLGIDRARWAHQHQTDSLGVDYFAHVVHVLSLVAAEHDDEDLCLIAVLHDSLGDTEVKVGEIQNLFGMRVAKGVAALTRRTGEDYFDKYLPWLMKNRDARIVKLADCRHNRGKGHLLARIDQFLAERAEKKYARVIEALTGKPEPALELTFEDAAWR